MRKTTLVFAAAILAAMLSSPVRAQSPGVIGQTVTAGGVTTTMNVSPIGRNDWMVEFRFESKTYPVGCLSAYRDARYELRNSRKQIVPVDQQTLAHPPYDGPSVVEPVSMRFSDRTKCSAPNGVWLTRAKISALYPNLAPGAYSLKITLVPRGSVAPAAATHIEFAPVTLSVVDARE